MTGEIATKLFCRETVFHFHMNNFSTIIENIIKNKAINFKKMLNRTVVTKTERFLFPFCDCDRTENKNERIIKFFFIFCNTLISLIEIEQET